MIAEDRISEALRQGRIGRVRAWWARRWCEHKKEDNCDSEERQFSNGIDFWRDQVYRCARCGCWYRLTLNFTGNSLRPVVLERPRLRLIAGGRE